MKQVEVALEDIEQIFLKVLVVEEVLKQHIQFQLDHIVWLLVVVVLVDLLLVLKVHLVWVLMDLKVIFIPHPYHILVQLT